MTLPERQRPRPEPVDLNVLYEDEELIALDKPPGIVVHPTYKNTSGTLLNGVLWRFRDRPQHQPGILTRLDKETSGVVVIALTPALHACMQRSPIDKLYVAIVHGRPQPRRGVISLPLGRDPVDRRRVVVTDAGAPSETRYEVVDEDGEDDLGMTVVHCVPVTGRTHQIRVHLAARGCPVVGDAVYGERSDRIARQALHAWRVSLVHPKTRERLTIEAPIPADISRLISSRS